MKRVLFLFAIVLFTQGCKFEEPIAFKMIDEVKIIDIKDGIVNLSAEAVFTNPNELKGKLKDVNILVDLDGKTLATITQAEPLTVKPKADFRIPINIQFAMEDVQKGLLSNLMSILSGNFIKLHFVGDIKIGTFIFSQIVEVDYYEEVKLQL
jgi:ribulose 1,5-bisphosphate carboxylase large subunit-like protein